jgi:hypothetical protein
MGSARVYELESEVEKPPVPAPEPEAEAEEAPAETAADRVLELQRTAGNQATTAALQRQSLQFTNPPSVSSTIGTGGLPPNLVPSADFAAKQDAENKQKVRTYLDANKQLVMSHVTTGWSMAELVNLVRTSVPEATRLAPETIEKLLTDWAAPQTIAAHRTPGDAKGAESELIATIKNSFSRIPTEVKLERKGAYFQVSLSGVEAGFKKDEENKFSVGTESGKDVAVNIAVKGVSFAAKLEQDGEKTKWEAGLMFRGDELVPMMGALGGLFGSANSAIGHVGAELASGKVEPGRLKEQFGPVKEAAEAVSAISKHTGVTFGVKVEGEGGEVRATATLTVTF